MILIASYPAEMKIYAIQMVAYNYIFTIGLHLGTIQFKEREKKKKKELSSNRYLENIIITY